ncbi:MAG: 23S rRNA (pseudouridine(1915)-N(3))-methyltransferase RlmH [SAR86 cluster bacterium]|jgi:23S rRNA (pseudouridine1915-N3)-methyltransferase|nr:23S rRNA (pseudouridine(1915)-N(3))-methyltransferase RlmH [SAR86 cluster bacterium]|tara:strand:+ start:350 stop:817 length:468 start_codon:yes stop_codon:yes gene_type:complete
MRINIISIESSRPEWTQEAFNSYKTKFNKSIDVIWVGCKPAQRSKNYNISAIIEKESALLLSKTKKEDLIVALDKEGSEVSTEKLRLSFDNWVSSSRDISFLIGGPDGLSRDLVRESDFCWSLSDLTFPHSIVPVLVIEQIFRVWSITQNHPYHK